MFCSCKTTSNKKIESIKENLTQKESWRYDIPKPEEPKAPMFPKQIIKVLDNGLTLMVVEDHSLPIVELSVAFKGGSSIDEKNFGINNLAISMLKEGTKSRSSLKLAEDCQYISC